MTMTFDENEKPMKTQRERDPRSMEAQRRGIPAAECTPDAPTCLEFTDRMWRMWHDGDQRYGVVRKAVKVIEPRGAKSVRVLLECGHEATVPKYARTQARCRSCKLPPPPYNGLPQ